jgi:hypothetical protein
LTLAEEVNELVRGGQRRLERPEDATAKDLTAEDITNLRNAVAELQEAVVRIAGEVDSLRHG